MALNAALIRLRNTVRLLIREPSLALRGPVWIQHLCERQPLANQGRPWVLSDQTLRSQDYREWRDAQAVNMDQERKSLLAWLRQQSNPPQLAMLLPVVRPQPRWLRQAIASVLAQSYPHWQLCIAVAATKDQRLSRRLRRFAARNPRVKFQLLSPTSTMSGCANAALAMATGEWFALLDPDDQLSPDALFWMARAISDHPTASLFYSDEDKLSAWGRHYDPYFKPAWNPALQEGQNLFARLGVYNSRLVRSLTGFREGYEGAEDYDLTLRCMDQLDDSPVIHIPKVLYHSRLSPARMMAGTACQPSISRAAVKALQDHYIRQGVEARVEAFSMGFRTHFPVSVDPPHVSVLVPTRNRVHLLEPCLRGLLESTDYPRLDVVVIDNGSDEEATLNYLKKIQLDPRVRVFRDPREFNYSALNNAAVARSSGELVLLMNNDIEVVEPGWLREMVAQILRPGVGAVGAKLLFPDHTVQHAGVILGLGGVASHGHLGIPEDDPGYFGRSMLVQDYSAVTGACLLVRRELFDRLGGLDERLKVAYNDIDMCLRIRQSGYRVLFTPWARLIHHESATRGAECPSSPRFLEEVALMSQRWGHVQLADPAYSPHLTLTRGDFSLPWPPRPGRVSRGPGLPAAVPPIPS
jgi:GT2 family glycosyltransferase